MRTIKIRTLTVAPMLLATTFLFASADETLTSKYSITSVNAEGAVVTQGVVLVLKKSGLVTGANTSCTDEYKGGKFFVAGNVLRKASCAKATGIIGKFVSAPQVENATRTFVAGEKLFVTRIDVKDTITFGLISDAIGDVRYRADLVFQKGNSADASEQTIAEVFATEAAPRESGMVTSAATPVTPPQAQAVEEFAPIAPPPAPSDAGAISPRKGSGAVTARMPVATPRPPPAPSPDSSATAPIAPPPPPSDQPAAPPAIVPGLTISQVTAMLGPPAKTADLGLKKIYSYGDLQVTFIDGKVEDIRDAAKDAPEVSASAAAVRTRVTSILIYIVASAAGVTLLTLGALLLAHLRARKVAPPHVSAASLPAKLNSTPWPPARPEPFSPQAHSRLEELKTLLDLGVINGGEFEAERTKIASSTPAPATPLQPSTIVLGQTADQVTRILGQPKNVVDLGRKKIYVYQVLKVTFTDGRVADVH